MIALPEPINSLIKSLEPKTITNFFGGPGTGKTNLCLIAALDCVKNNGNVIYIDTEGGFSLERLKQLSTAYETDHESVLKKTRLLEPKTFSEQGNMIRTLEDLDADLVIVDSMVALYRLEFSDQKQLKEVNVQILEANRELSKQLSILSNLARKKEIPVIITAHAFKNWDTGDNEVAGGDAVKYWSKIIVFLEKTGKTSERKATLIKHMHAEEHRDVKFMIVNEGIKPSGFKLF